MGNAFMTAWRVQGAMIACVLALAAAGCSYSPLSLVDKEEPPPDDPCLALACESRGMSCVDGACNGPPILTPELQQLAVHRNVEVGLTVRAMDPEGDPLTFTWKLGAPCTPLELETAAPVAAFSLDAAEGEVCTVEVTATDSAYQASNTVLLELSLLAGPSASVGGYVDAAHDACLVGFDPIAVIDQGTKTSPFCALQGGLDAATMWGVYVRVSNAAQVVEVQQTLTEGVVVEGGYVVSEDDEWSRPEGARTLLQVNSGIAFAIGEHAEGAAPSWLIGFDLVRATVCESPCDFFYLSRADLTLREVSLGRVSLPGGSAHGATGEGRYTGVFVLGDCGEVGAGSPRRPTRLVFETVDFAAPTLGARVSAVNASGGADSDVYVTIRDSHLEVGPASDFAAAVWTRGVAELVVERSALRAAVVTPGASASGYALLDGNPLASDCAADAAVCGGSGKVVLRDVVAQSHGYVSATGVGAFGTSRLLLERVSDPMISLVAGAVSAKASDLAIGIRTIAAGDVTLADMTVVAETGSQDKNAAGDWALAAFDGWIVDDVVQGGAASYEVLGGALVAGRRAPLAETTGVMAFATYGARSLVIRDDAWLQVHEFEPASAQPVVPVERIAALWTIEARHVDVHDATILLGEDPRRPAGDVEWGPAVNYRAYDHAAAVFDRGLGSEVTDDTSYRLEANQIFAAVGYAADQWSDADGYVYDNSATFRGAGVVVRERAGAAIAANKVFVRRVEVLDLAGELGGANLPGLEPPLHGILVRNTTSSLIQDNDVEVEAGAHPPPELFVAGIADGQRAGDDIEAHASLDLVIERNRVWVTSPRVDADQGATLHGVWLIGTRGATLLVNNYVAAWGSDRLVGMHLDHVHADVAFNTVRLARCVTSGCPEPLAIARTSLAPLPYGVTVTSFIEPYAVGIYGLDLDDMDSGGKRLGAVVTNNLVAFEPDLSTPAPGIAYALVDDPSLTNVFGFTRVAGNLVAPSSGSHVVYAFAGGEDTYGLPLTPLASASDPGRLCGNLGDVGVAVGSCLDVFPATCVSQRVDAVSLFAEDANLRGSDGFVLGADAKARDKACAEGVSAEVDVTGVGRLSTDNLELDVGAFELH